MDTIYDNNPITLGRSPACEEAKLRERDATELAGECWKRSCSPQRENRAGCCHLRRPMVSFPAKGAAPGSGSCSQVRAVPYGVSGVGCLKNNWNILRWKNRKSPFKLSSDLYLDDITLILSYTQHLDKHPHSYPLTH